MMLQTYYGYGKGKTSAAIGAAIRAVGSDMKVLFIQFFKNGDSFECPVLKGIEGIDFRLPSEGYVLFQELDEECVSKRSESYSKLVFEELPQRAADYQMIVLDEMLDALEFGYVDENKFVLLVDELKLNTEIIITGHKISDNISLISDYISEINEIKHPFSLGLKPRKGIEY